MHIDRMSKIYNPELLSCVLTDNKLQSPNEYSPFDVIARFVNDLKDVNTFLFVRLSAAANLPHS